MGLKRVFGGNDSICNDSIYCVGGRTAVGVGRCDAAHASQRFAQGGIGLHHVCFRCRSKEDVVKAYEFLLEQDAKIIHPPEDGPWAAGYYSILFEDPAGVRIELNHVPDKGVLEEDAQFNPAGDYH